MTTSLLPEPTRLVVMQFLELHVRRHGGPHAEVARAYEALGGQYATLRDIADRTKEQM